MGRLVTEKRLNHTNILILQQTLKSFDKEFESPRAAPAALGICRFQHEDVPLAWELEKVPLDNPADAAGTAAVHGDNGIALSGGDRFTLREGVKTAGSRVVSQGTYCLEFAFLISAFTPGKAGGRSR